MIRTHDKRCPGHLSSTLYDAG